MKYLLLFPLFVSCMSLQKQDTFPLENIKVVVNDPHPFLRDHFRQLQTVDKKGNVIDFDSLYPDTGRGTSTFLFLDSNAYIVIDCNGTWFSIDKSNGQITDLGWLWEETLPTKYYGEFVYTGKDYVLEKRDSVKPADVYIHKDPGKYGGW